MSTNLRVLYEDNHLLGVYKPAGVLTQADQGAEPNLLDLVKTWIAERYAKPGRVFVGMVHRLDRPVSGVMLFAKTSKAASRISQQFRERSVEKVYWARLEGVIAPASGRLEHFLEHTEGVRRVSIRHRASASAKAASLRYETLSRVAGQCIVATTLETGRKHQIRAQFAHVGHPIVGDALYGAAKQIPSGEAAKQIPLRDAAIALCAVRLTFSHPTTATRITLALPSELLPAELAHAGSTE